MYIPVHTYTVISTIKIFKTIVEGARKMAQWVKWLRIGAQSLERREKPGMAVQAYNPRTG